MNDHEAIDAITEVIESYGEHGMDAIAAVNKIAYIIGFNKISHQAAKEQGA